ncbi:MAG: hypothetical protein ACLFSY_05095 [Desulfonatronovibrionaceae bacterium]
MNKKDPAEHSFSRDFDIVEMPLEGVIAYWLSLKKILSGKRTKDILQKEQDRTTEPFIRHLLGLLDSGLETKEISKFGRIKKQTLLKDLQRKLDLMAISLLGMATNENPQMVLIRIISKFPISPIYEKKVFEAAQNIIRTAEQKEADMDRFFNVDHRLRLERLIINLIVYNMLERRKGTQALSDYMGYLRSFYYAEGLSLLIDGFEYDFIKHRLNLQKNEIVELTATKMNLSLNLCAALHSGRSYADMQKMAASYNL